MKFFKIGFTVLFIASVFSWINANSDIQNKKSSTQEVKKLKD